MVDLCNCATRPTLCGMPPTDCSPGARGKHAAVYVSLHRGEEAHRSTSRSFVCSRASPARATRSTRPALRNQRIRRVVGHALRVCILPSSWAAWSSYPRPGQRLWTLQDAGVRAQSGTSVAFTGDRRSVTVVHLADGAPTAHSTPAGGSGSPPPLVASRPRTPRGPHCNSWSGPDRTKEHRRAM